MHQLFLCQFKGEEYVSVSTLEEVMALVGHYKPENWHEFEKYLRRDDPPGYNEYLAELYDESLPVDKRNLKTLIIDRYKYKVLETDLFEQLQHFKIQKISFSESLLDMLLKLMDQYFFRIWKSIHDQFNGSACRVEIP